MEKYCERLFESLGVMICQIDFRKNGKVEAELGSIGFALVQTLRGSIGHEAPAWFHEMFVATIQEGFDSLRQDYRISHMNQELMLYSYIRLREEAGLAPFELPPTI